MDKRPQDSMVFVDPHIYNEINTIPLSFIRVFLSFFVWLGEMIEEGLDPR